MFRPILGCGDKNRWYPGSHCVGCADVFHRFDGVCEICSVREIQSKFDDWVPLIVDEGVQGRSLFSFFSWFIPVSMVKPVSGSFQVQNCRRLAALDRRVAGLAALGSRRRVVEVASCCLLPTVLLPFAEPLRAGAAACVAAGCSSGHTVWFFAKSGKMLERRAAVFCHAFSYQISHHS